MSVEKYGQDASPSKRDEEGPEDQKNKPTQDENRPIEQYCAQTFDSLHA
jgi:hypothetical protein